MTLGDEAQAYRLIALHQHPGVIEKRISRAGEMAQNRLQSLAVHRVRELESSFRGGSKLRRADPSKALPAALGQLGRKSEIGHASNVEIDRGAPRFHSAATSKSRRGFLTPGSRSGQEFRFPRNGWRRVA